MSAGLDFPSKFSQLGRFAAVRRSLLAAIAILAVAASTACSGAVPVDLASFDPVGVWEHREDGHTTSLYIYADGQLILKGIPTAIADREQQYIYWGNVADHTGCWRDDVKRTDGGDPNFPIYSDGVLFNQVRVDGEDHIYLHYGSTEPPSRFEFSRKMGANLPTPDVNPQNC